MTSKKALKIARAAARGRATVTLHRGATAADRAIRISGCWPEAAVEIGRDLERELGVDGLRRAAGFVAVWF